MWKLPRPTYPARDTFLTCVSRIRNVDLRQRLIAVADIVADAAATYDVAAAQTRLHTVPQTTSIGNTVTADEMVAVYEDRMARQGRPGRAIYDALISAPAHGRCPLCGQRTVSTLDHYLSKRRYPALAVSPTNLVPACSDCNKAKLAAFPRNAEEETLHPYFDDVEGDAWLAADIVEASPPALRFFVAAVPHWSDTMRARVQHHFEAFELGSLYASHAAVELQNIKQYLIDLREKAGTEAVRGHLADRAASCAAFRLNAWQTATYSALADNDWYCSGGFAA